MKKKNSMQMMLASMALMLMASPAFAQKFKVAKVERTRILVDKKWDVQPDAEAAKFIAPYQHKVDSIMGPVVGSVAHDMTRHRPESELSNLLSDILVWGGRQFNEQPVFSVYNMGGIRADFAKGDINVGDVSEVAPFENKICFLTLTGEKVLELFQPVGVALGIDGVGRHIDATSTFVFQSEVRLIHHVLVDIEIVVASQSHVSCYAHLESVAEVVGIR